MESSRLIGIARCIKQITRDLIGSIIYKRRMCNRLCPFISKICSINCNHLSINLSTFFTRKTTQRISGTQCDKCKNSASKKRHYNCDALSEEDYLRHADREKVGDRRTRQRSQKEHEYPATYVRTLCVKIRNECIAMTSVAPASHYIDIIALIPHVLKRAVIKLIFELFAEIRWDVPSVGYFARKSHHVPWYSLSTDVWGA